MTLSRSNSPDSPWTRLHPNKLFLILHNILWGKSDECMKIAFLRAPRKLQTFLFATYSPIYRFFWYICPQLQVVDINYGSKNTKLFCELKFIVSNHFSGETINSNDFLCHQLIKNCTKLASTFFKMTGLTHLRSADAIFANFEEGLLYLHLRCFLWEGSWINFLLVFC